LFFVAIPPTDATGWMRSAQDEHHPATRGGERILAILGPVRLSANCRCLTAGRGLPRSRRCRTLSCVVGSERDSVGRCGRKPEHNTHLRRIGLVRANWTPDHHPAPDRARGTKRTATASIECAGALVASLGDRRAGRGSWQCGAGLRMLSNGLKLEQRSATFSGCFLTVYLTVCRWPG
jgi:hypothetical protein